MTIPLLSIQGLKTQFNPSHEIIKAVDGISLDIAQGEAVALVGESGCGKSVSALSVLRLLPNNAQITEGKVLYRGSDLLRVTEQEMRAVRGLRISMIFQDPMSSLNPVMSIGDQIAEAILAHKKQSSGELKQRVVKLIKQVGIPDSEQRYDAFPHQLSGGMRQRVMIAIALANEPELLIADEPTTALDVTIQSQILQLLKDLQRQMGMSLWIITHDLGIVSDIADKVAVMYAGQLVEVASRDAFFKNPLHPYSQRLFNAVPTMEKRHESLVTLSGSVPKLSRTFTGCRFAERCDYKVPDCIETGAIKWKRISGTQQVRCIKLNDVDGIEKPSQVRKNDHLVNSNHIVLKVNQLKVHFPIKKGLLKRKVGHVKAVDDVSFDLLAGSTTALVGESGCGKTTLGKALLQLLPISSGEVHYQGENLSGLSETAFQSYRKQLQIIFQDPFSSMNPRMLVGDILEEGIRTLKPELNEADITQQCNALLKRVGLNSDVRLRYPHEFSGGQRQRLCIARALAVNPSILVCDEPTSALDVSVQAQVLNLLKELQHEQGLSYLFITHDLSVVAYLADNVAVMYLGRIVEYGSVDEVLNHPAHPYTRALIEAVPTWNDPKEKKVIKLSDDMPSPANPPSGCHFHTRCEHVMAECRKKTPTGVFLNSNHRVNCLLYR